jgi:hypothetical protein
VGKDIEIPGQNIWVCGKCGASNESHLPICRDFGEKMKKIIFTLAILFISHLSI